MQASIGFEAGIGGGLHAARAGRIVFQVVSGSFIVLLLLCAVMIQTGKIQGRNIRQEFGA